MKAGRVLVLDAQDLCGLAAIRCLGRSGFAVTGAAMSPQAVGLWSRWCNARRVLPNPADGLDQFIAALRQLLTAEPHDVVLAGRDETVYALSAGRDAIAPQVRVGLPDQSFVQRALDKACLATEAARVGLPTPEQKLCADAQAALQAARAFGWPVLVKPVATSFAVSGRIDRHPSRLVNDAAGLIELSAALGTCLVQRQIRGAVLSVGGVATEAGLIGAAVSRYRRTWPPQAGRSSYTETIAPPADLIARVQALVSGIGWTGMFELELIETSSGELHAIDFNPRPYASLGLAAAAGAPLSALWCEWLLTGASPPLVLARPGVHFRNETRELRNLLRSLRARRYPEAMAVLRPRRSTAHAVFHWRDPKPALMSLVSVARSRARRREDPSLASPGPPNPEAPGQETVPPSGAVTTRRATIDIAIQVAGRVANLALGVAVTALIVRTLGQRGFGQWSTIFAVMGIVAYFGNLGLEQVAVKQATAEPEHQAEWLGALLTLRVALAVPIALAAGAVIVAIATGSAMRVAGLIVPAILIVGAPTTLRTVFQLRVRNGITTALITFQSVLWAAAVVAIAAVHGGLVLFAVAMLATTAINAAAHVWWALRVLPIKLRWTRERWQPLIALGAPVGLVGLLTLAYGRIDQVLVFQIAGDRQAGLYGSVYRVLDQAQFLPIAFMTTLFPIIAAAHAVDQRRVRLSLQAAADYLLLASLPMLAFTIVAAPPLVRALFGSQFVPAASTLPVLMGAFVLICFGYITGNMIIVLALQRRSVRYAILALVFNVVANLVLIGPYGYQAAAWTTLATEALVLALTGRLVLRELDWRPHLGRMARIAISAAGMAGAVAAVRGAGGGLASLIAVAAVSYALLVLALRAVELEELRTLIRSRTADAPS